MCRLFGFRSAVPSRAHRSLLEAENALSSQSQRHPDGWGIGWFVDDDAYVVKSANAAYACERFRRASVGLSSHTMLVHVRRATVGQNDHMNAHPFRYGRWLFAHNGTVFGLDEGDGPTLGDWMRAQVDEAFQPLILGDTDSELLFYFLLSALVDNGVARSGRLPSDASVVGTVVRRALSALDDEVQRRGLERPITNVLLTDGRLFVAHRAGMPLLMSTQKRSCADFHTCPEPTKVCMLPTRPEGRPVNHLLVASEPIGDENVWEAIAEGCTLICDEHFGLSWLHAPAGWVAPELPERYRLAAAPDCGDPTLGGLVSAG